MVQLVGVLYISATVVYSLQTLNWQTFDVYLDTILIWRKTRVHLTYSIPLPTDNVNLTDSGVQHIQYPY